jgi:hypothetical protein
MFGYSGVFLGGIFFLQHFSMRVPFASLSLPTSAIFTINSIIYKSSHATNGLTTEHRNYPCTSRVLLNLLLIFSTYGLGGRSRGLPLQTMPALQR